MCTVHFFPKGTQAARMGGVTKVNADDTVNMASFNEGGTAGCVWNVLWSDSPVSAPTDKNVQVACPLA